MDNEGDNYKQDLSSIINDLGNWVSNGTISKMVVGQNTNLTINADQSKMYITYNSEGEKHRRSLKLRKVKYTKSS